MALVAAAVSSAVVIATTANADEAPTAAYGTPTTDGVIDAS